MNGMLLKHTCFLQLHSLTEPLKFAAMNIFGGLLKKTERYQITVVIIDRYAELARAIRSVRIKPQTWSLFSWMMGLFGTELQCKSWQTIARTLNVILHRVLHASCHRAADHERLLRTFKRISGVTYSNDCYATTPLSCGLFVRMRCTCSGASPPVQYAAHRSTNADSLHLWPARDRLGPEAFEKD